MNPIEEKLRLLKPVIPQKHWDYLRLRYIIEKDMRRRVEIENMIDLLIAQNIPGLQMDQILLPPPDENILSGEYPVGNINYPGSPNGIFGIREKEWIKHSGIFGKTGSGKTTSLYAILNELNKPDINIITLEDPVEYRIENIRQIQLNLRAGMTFSSGLRSILRQDPDVIMVGEIRDPETAAISVQAAMTGHRVLSTVHTNDAAGAVTRFIEMGVEPFLISTVLLASFAQRLVRTVCPYCKEPYRPPAKALAAWGLDKYEKANFQHGKGCYQCLNTGYKGRTGIFEVLINDSLIQDMIVKKSSAHEIIRAAEAAGKLRNLKTDAASKVLQGITTLEEAASAVMV